MGGPPGDGEELSRLREQLASAWGEIKQLRRTVAHQARQLSLLEPETHPAAPSLNCCYWIYSLAHEHTKSWSTHRNRLLPSLGGMGTMPAPDVTPMAWSRHLIVRRREDQRGGGTPCAHTLNVELGRLKGMLDWCVGAGMIAFNPLKPAKYEQTVSRRETKLKPVDIERLLEEAALVRDRRKQDYDDDGTRSASLRALILCWHDSMLRFNEGRHLRRDLIEPNGDYPVNRPETKTEAGVRTISLTPRTLEAIAQVPVHPETNYVFVNHETGGLIGETTVRGWWRWTCEHGRLDARAAPRDRRLVPHHLRHAGATAADAAGARPTALQIALGQDDLRATLRYLHRDKVESARHVSEKIQEATAPLRRGPQKAMRPRQQKVKKRQNNR